MLVKDMSVARPGLATLFWKLQTYKLPTKDVIIL